MNFCIKKIITAVTVALPAFSLAVPLAPDINISAVGEQIIVNFDPVDGATGYKLYYAAYPKLSPVYSIDLGTSTSFRSNLNVEDFYAVAVKSYDNSGESGFSNIDVASLNEALSGGDTTLADASTHAFSSPAPNLDEAGLDQHLAGDADFEAVFVTSPAVVNAGLGPVFNQTSCEGCHPKDGRGAPPENGGTFDTMFLRLSIPGKDAITGGPVAVEGFGTQLFQKAVFGVQSHADVTVSYAEENKTFADGKAYTLRTPGYDVKPYIQLPDNVMFSPRVAPAVFGRGLLEAVPEATIVALADENDSDGDGISGKPNYVWHPVEKKTVLGRFGLKANNPTLLIQNAGAYHGDIGITSPIFPVDTSAGLPQDDGLQDDPEISMETLENVTFYVQTLSVPARRNTDKLEVRQGQIIFAQAGCGSCHIPTLKTGEFEGVSSISNQVIHPYTDMLLHDMGDGLADNRPDFLADGNEWRTPPLWAIGLTEVVHGHTFFLHDGRARNLIEAIMWHGGEAENAKNHVNNLTEAQRDALIAFLNSL